MKSTLNLAAKEPHLNRSGPTVVGGKIGIRVSVTMGCSSKSKKHYNPRISQRSACVEAAVST